MAIGYKCSDGGCGIVRADRWRGRCPGCGGFANCRRVVADIGGNEDGEPPPRGEVIGLNDIVAVSFERISTGFTGTDRVLGFDPVTGNAGIAAKGGQAIQLYGPPGSGKSTLLLQLCREITKQRYRALYAAGEEPLSQIKARADRIGKFNSRMQIVDEQDLDAILAAIDEHKPDLFVVDSIQTISVEEYVTGSLTAIVIAAREIYRFCHARGIAVIFVVQISKDGSDFAGPKALEHIIDTSLFLKKLRGDLRMLESSKNRFGESPAQQLFKMTAAGLIETEDESEEEDEFEPPPETPPSPPTLVSVP